MRIAFALLSPLLLLGGCASTAMGPHGAQAQAMANCPMASGSGDHQQGAMTGDHGGQMMGQGQMGQGQMMQGMHQGDIANCPMMQGSSTPTPPPADPHQH